MAEIEMPVFLRNVARLDMYSNYPKARIWKDQIHRAEVLDMLSIVRDQCRRSGLDAAEAADAVMARLSRPEYEVDTLLPHHISGLREQIVSNMRALRYFEIPENRVPYWTDTELFGDEVKTQFKSCGHDIEHASRCIALDMYTASVFHSCRVVEVGINALWLALGGALPVMYDRSWGKILGKIKGQVELRANSKDPKWVARTPEMWAAHGAFSFAKTEWRDDTMHVGAKHDDKEAIRVYTATKGLMQHLSRWFNEDGKWLNP